MRIAILADIHGNLAALQAVVNDLDRQGVDDVLVGGDLVDGGRQPAEVIDLLRDRRWAVVRGNSDRGIVEVLDGAVILAPPWHACAEWTLGQLGPTRVEFLRGLPTAVRRALPGGRELLVVHATPWHDRGIVRPDAPIEVARRLLSAGQADVVAYGHIHRAYHRAVDGGLVLSVGAVSWSHDRDPRPAYSVLEVDQTIRVEVRRVSYDAEAEATALTRVGHPVSEIVRTRMLGGGPAAVWRS